MPEVADIGLLVREANTVGDAVERWLEHQEGERFHYRNDIWDALVLLSPGMFAVSENRKTPWFSIHKTIQNDPRFTSLGDGYFRLATGEDATRRWRSEARPRCSNLFVDAKKVVNEYLAAILPDTRLIFDPDVIEAQRKLFVEQFGPERLAEMSGPELLRRLPNNAVDEQPMDYWLEFRNDEDFNYRLFGSIAGGSAAKYGAWQDKSTGSWRAKLVNASTLQNITEDKAMELVDERRREILAAVERLDGFRGARPMDIDPAAFQAAIEAAAPRWHRSAWLHKYLHMVRPELVTWNATENYSNAELGHLGIVPPGLGIYANDVMIIDYWSSLPALSDLPIPIRYRLGHGIIPRDHWCLRLEQFGPEKLQRMISGKCMALGPREIGDLTEIIALNKKRDIQMAIETEFKEVGLASDSADARSLVELAYRLQEGSIISLLSDSSTVVAVGEVVGGYQFVAGDAYPHQVTVYWLHDRPFQTTRPLASGSTLISAKLHDPIVADIEASLLVNGVSHWPEFSTIITPHPPLESIDSPDSPPPLRELPELSRQLIEMLERKRQVILYGPPGTGKTYHAERVARELVARHNFGRAFAALTREQRKQIAGPEAEEPFVESCTFHPMYSYEDFIEGYRPDGEGFSLRPGIFKRMATTAAARPDKKFVLIIDEINRGNIARIFGELITLVEASKRGDSHATLPLSGERFSVPDNLYLIGTMNTADRSILLLDTALRRRFAFKELMPQPATLKGSMIGEVSLAAWLRALNRRIVAQLGRDGRNLQIGHAYLMASSGKPVSKLSRIGEILRDEIWPLLQEYCYEDARKLENILGDLYNRERANLRFELFEPGQEEELTRALVAVLTPEDKKEDAALGEELSDEEDELS